GPHGPFDGDFVDVSRFRISPEDALLLCTDGLTDLVTSHEIAEIVRSSPDDLARAADELVRAALARGGKDNVSVVLAAGPRVAAQRVLVVGPGRQFNVIGDALAAARSGDTVRVAPGTYHEQVRLKDGVTLMSATPRGATLVPTSDGTAVVAVVAEGIGSGRIQ